MDLSIDCEDVEAAPSVTVDVAIYSQHPSPAFDKQVQRLLHARVTRAEAAWQVGEPHAWPQTPFSPLESGP